MRGRAVLKMERAIFVGKGGPPRSPPCCESVLQPHRCGRVDPLPPLREEGGCAFRAHAVRDLLRGDLLPSHQGPTPFLGGGAATRCNPPLPPSLPRHSTPRAGSESTRKPRKRVLINHQFPRAICEGSSLAADTARPEAKNESSNEHRIYGPRFSPPGDICRGRASSSDLSLTR